VRAQLFANPWRERRSGEICRPADTAVRCILKNRATRRRGTCLAGEIERAFGNGILNQAALPGIFRRAEHSTLPTGTCTRRPFLVNVPSLTRCRCPVGRSHQGTVANLRRVTSLPALFLSCEYSPHRKLTSVGSKRHATQMSFGLLVPERSHRINSRRPAGWQIRG